MNLVGGILNQQRGMKREETITIDEATQSRVCKVSVHFVKNQKAMVSEGSSNSTTNILLSPCIASFTDSYTA